jgi:hypothetical protein
MTRAAPGLHEQDSEEATMKIRALVCVPLLAACGNGAPGTHYNPPYATLHGAIVSSSVQTPADVRVALVWEVQGAGAGAPTLRAAQELGVRTDFPVKFTLDVNALPPAEALSTIDSAKAAAAGVDPNLRIGKGTLLVYEDTNGNGRLDLLPVDAQTTVDRVLGVPDSLAVVYVEGTPPPPLTDGPLAGFTLASGFNLLREPTYTDPQPGCGAQCFPQATGSWALLPLDTEITIALTADPALSRYLCQQGQGTMGAGGSVCNHPGCPIDVPPAGAQLTCSADRLSYVYKVCNSSLCGPSWCFYGSGTRSAGAPIPTGWPCP